MNNYKQLRVYTDYFDVIENIADNRITVKISTEGLYQILYLADSYEYSSADEYLPKSDDLIIEILILDESATEFYITKISNNDHDILTVSEQPDIINSGLGRLFKFESIVLGNSGIWLTKEEEEL